MLRGTPLCTYGCGPVGAVRGRGGGAGSASQRYPRDEGRGHAASTLALRRGGSTGPARRTWLWLSRSCSRIGTTELARDRGRDGRRSAGGRGGSGFRTVERPPALTGGNRA